MSPKPAATDCAHHAYGPDPSQHAELRLPDGRPRGTVVVVHGGFWRARYDLLLGRPLARDLTARGWVTWNLEYRRVGNGGGAPATFEDVSAGIDLLADLVADGAVPPAALERVVALGHSAGGHLAAWAAGRPAPRAKVTHVVGQAAALDLVAAHRDGLGDGAVEAFLGHPPGPDDAQYDPAQQVPLDVPVWCVHARDDEVVPFTQSAGYVAKATAAGATAELVEVTGGHFGVIEKAGPAWARILGILDRIG